MCGDGGFPCSTQGGKLHRSSLHGGHRQRPGCHKRRCTRSIAGARRAQQRHREQQRSSSGSVRGVYGCSWGGGGGRRPRQRSDRRQLGCRLACGRYQCGVSSLTGGHPHQRPTSRGSAHRRCAGGWGISHGSPSCVTSAGGSHPRDWRQCSGGGGVTTVCGWWRYVSHPGAAAPNPTSRRPSRGRVHAGTTTPHLPASGLAAGSRHQRQLLSPVRISSSPFKRLK